MFSCIITVSNAFIIFILSLVLKAITDMVTLKHVFGTFHGFQGSKLDQNKI